MLLQKLAGNSSNNVAEVDANHQLMVALSNDVNLAGKARFMSENDDGSFTGVTRLMSPEVDADYRIRTADDVLLDDETFNYTAQNTGKHSTLAAAVNLVPAWQGGGYNTNPTNVTTSTSGATLSTYAMFTHVSTGTLSVDIEASFSALPTSNTVIDFGLFLGAITNPFAPTDGVYFRLTSAGLTGVANYNGNETFATTNPFPNNEGTGTWAYTPNKKYQFIIYITNKEAQFWVNSGDIDGTCLLGVIPVPAGQGTLMMATSLPFHVRHAIVGGAAGIALNMILSRYSVRIGGIAQTERLAVLQSRNACYQGLSGGTVGSLMFGAISSGSISAPAAAVPQNASLSAGLCTGLGGLIYETNTLAVGVDGILLSYQVPAGTVAVQGRRLRITGMGLTSFIQTVVVGGPYINQYYLAFGNTAASLATGETTFAKAPRRMALPFVQIVTAAQAVLTDIAQAVRTISFDNPIYVNPGEFVQLVVRRIGATGTSGVHAHVITMDYSWE